MTRPDLEYPTTVEALDAVEAGEVLEFVADWLDSAGRAVAADLARLVDPAAYPLGSLAADCRRLAVAFGAETNR